MPPTTHATGNTCLTTLEETVCYLNFTIIIVIIGLFIKDLHQILYLSIKHGYHVDPRSYNNI